MTPIFRSDLKVDLLGCYGSDLTIARAAWVSSGQEENTERVKGLINALMKQRHGTPFETGYFEFRIEAPRSVSIEMMRHRVGWSYSSASLRYREQSPEIYIPSKERPLKKSDAFKSMRPTYEVLSEEEYKEYVKISTEAHTTMYTFYERMREIRPETEALRFLTSEALYLPYIARCNPRSLMHFLALRTHDENANHVSYPMYEIEQVARKMEAHFADLFPITHAAFNDLGREAP